MPSHHGVRLDEHERGAPVPPRLGQDDPKQPVPFPQLRTRAGASQRIELLTEREVLEGQFAMSSTGQREGTDEYNHHLQHASFCRATRGEASSSRPILIVARDRC
jgi:hypothetical protein